MKQKIAGFYMGKFYALDNFSAFQVYFRGEVFMTAEHAYQFAKFSDDPNWTASFEDGDDIRLGLSWPRTQIRYATSAHDAKQEGRKYGELRNPNWDSLKLFMMEEILRNKAKMHEYVRETLGRTKDLPIIETSPVDDFWGWGPNKDGHNHLGKLWMKIRLEMLGLEVVDYIPEP